LYFRLNGICLTIPPLREREREILPLAREFAAESSARLAVPTPSFSPPALSWLERYPWPGNIRELRSVVDRAVLLAQGGTLEVEHLQVDAEFSGGALRAPGSPLAEPVLVRDLRPAEPGHLGVPASIAGGPAGEKLRDELDRLERDRIVDAIARCRGNQTKAADLLGISRRALLHRLDAYGLPRPRKGV
jgi:DNA-binding NtrC family response regulator